MGRKSCLMEIDPQYTDVIVRRYQGFVAGRRFWMVMAAVLRKWRGTGYRKRLNAKSRLGARKAH
jgi:hypothetical protein